MQEQCAVNTGSKKKNTIKWWYPGKGYTGESTSGKWISIITANNRKGDGRWASIYTRRWNKPTISFRISPASYFDNRLMIHIDFLWISLYLHLPIYSTINECEYPEFGFYYHGNSLVLCWNMKKKFISMPWTHQWYRTSRLLKDGSWEHEIKGGKRKEYSRERDKWEMENLWQETHHYPYVMNNGTIQDDIDATIKVEEREWRPKWFMWTKLFSHVSKTIDVEFNNEVGNQRGSWKGGTLGCGYEMKKNETPVQTLRRMQRERSFCR